MSNSTKKKKDKKMAIFSESFMQKHLLHLPFLLQVFNKEADNIDSVTGNHEKFLALSDLGVSGYN